MSCGKNQEDSGIKPKNELDFDEKTRYLYKKKKEIVGKINGMIIFANLLDKNPFK